MPVGGTDDSSHAREWVQAQRPMDATAHSPGAASWLCCPAIDTARAGDRDGNYGYWPHRRRAGSHRLLCVAHGHEAPGQRDSAASHLAGEESLDQRSGPLSRASPPEGEHSPRECAIEACHCSLQEWNTTGVEVVKAAPDLHSKGLGEQ